MNRSDLQNCLKSRQKNRLLPLLLLFSLATPPGMLLTSSLLHADDEHEHHGGDSNHSDQLLVLLNHKIALQKLQADFPDDVALQSKNLARQKRHLDQALPVLEAYLKIPAERYPNTSLYHQSLQNRSAMLQDYAHIVSEFYHKLIGG